MGKLSQFRAVYCTQFQLGIVIANSRLVRSADPGRDGMALEV